MRVQEEPAGRASEPRAPIDFSLIRHTAIFILFDTVQFIRHGWIERNRILKPVEG